MPVRRADFLTMRYVTSCLEEPVAWFAWNSIEFCRGQAPDLCFAGITRDDRVADRYFPMDISARTVLKSLWRDFPGRCPNRENRGSPNGGNRDRFRTGVFG